MTTVDPNPKIVQKAAFWAKQVWVGILAVSGGFEIYGVLHPQKEDTLSETTRWIFRTDTPKGKWAFGLSWVAFSVWFLPHILKVAKQSKK